MRHFSVSKGIMLSLAICPWLTTKGSVTGHDWSRTVLCGQLVRQKMLILVPVFQGGPGADLITPNPLPPPQLTHPEGVSPGSVGEQVRFWTKRSTGSLIMWQMRNNFIRFYTWNWGWSVSLLVMTPIKTYRPFLTRVGIHLSTSTEMSTFYTAFWDITLQHYTLLQGTAKCLNNWNISLWLHIILIS